MKQVFVGLVVICSLLFVICGCSDDFILQEEQESESSDTNQREPGSNRPDSSYDEESDDPDSEDIDQEEEDDFEPPVFADFNLFSKKEIRFNFTGAVKNVSCTFTPHQEIERIQEGKTVRIFLKENLELQTEFIIELNAKDNWENSLSVEIPLFVNDWIPKIEINELRAVYSGSTSRVEYIEFKVKSAGDLEGLRLYIMWDAKKPYFDLPAVDVKLGEYITLHMRTLESVCVNELGEDLSESAGTDSCPTARDLWIPGSATKWLHKTDIVYLQDANGVILDAVILNETPAEKWSRGHFAEIVEDLYNRGAWKSDNGQPPGPFDAVDTSSVKSSATKSISRYEGKENTRTAKDWYITDSNKASPGLPNK